MKGKLEQVMESQNSLVTIGIFVIFTILFLILSSLNNMNKEQGQRILSKNYITIENQSEQIWMALTLFEIQEGRNPLNLSELVYKNILVREPTFNGKQWYLEKDKKFYTRTDNQELCHYINEKNTTPSKVWQKNIQCFKEDLGSDNIIKVEIK